MVSRVNKSNSVKGKGKKRKNEEDVATIAKQCLAEIKQIGVDVNDSDEDDKYGTYIASQLRKINDEGTKQVLKAEIQNLFVKACTGSLKVGQQSAGTETNFRPPPLHQVAPYMEHSPYLSHINQSTWNPSIRMSMFPSSFAPMSDNCFNEMNNFLGPQS